MSYSFEQIERKAVETVCNAGLTGVIPVPLERLAGFLGFVTFEISAAKDISGAIDYEKKQIYINNVDSPQRQRFTLAHEIGHAVLHSGESVIDYRVNFDAPKERKEVEANRFAADLLMPRLEFTDVWHTRYGNITRVAAYFGVSEAAARFRAQNLGLNC
jgi:Zn-dependent peptidase ImmA (M78 family)